MHKTNLLKLLFCLIFTISISAVLNGQSTEICDNAIDDDGDSLIDCEDEDCIVDDLVSKVLDMRDNNYARDIQAVDLDGDADLDIVMTGGDSGDYDDFFINTGEGEFFRLNGNVGYGDAYAGALGDIDGDQDVDYITSDGSQIQIFKNTEGVFDSYSYSSISGADTIYEIVLADVNQDGHLDLLLGYVGAASLCEVRINDGTGNFILSSFFGENSRARHFIVADINSDGISDVVVQQRHNNSTSDPEPEVRFFVNQGQGLMIETGEPILGCTDPDTKSIDLGDIDGDGDLDLVYVQRGNVNYGTCLYDPVQIFENTGSGTFAPVAQSLWDFLNLDDTNDYCIDVAKFVDVNIDGVMDLVLGFDGCRPSVVLINNGTGEFVSYLEGSVLSGDYGFAVADLDSDPYPELICKSNNSSYVEILDVDADQVVSGLEVISSNYSEWITGPQKLLKADFDGSSGDEIVVISSNGLSRILKRTQDDYFEPYFFLPNYSTRGFASGDVNGDGFRDIFFSGNSQFTSLMYGNDIGNFVSSGLFFGQNNGEVFLLDIDSDQNLDLVIQQFDNGPEVYWYKNDGSGGFAFPELLYEPIQNFYVENLKLIDLNSDGFKDLVLLGRGNNSANRVLFGDGAGVFSDSGQLLGSYQTNDAEIADFDADGDMDMVTSNTNGGPSVVWINDGSGYFFSLPDDQHLLNNGQSMSGVDSGDFDSDGDLDILFSESNSNSNSVSIFLNQGNASFLPLENDVYDYGPHKVFYDINDDGKLDILSHAGETLIGSVSVNGCGVDDDLDGIPNSCDVDFSSGEDCDLDGQLDFCQLDFDNDGVIDQCDDDIDGDGVLNPCDPDQSAGSDCNVNGILDVCDTAEGTSADCDSNNIPDECEYIEGADCNFNGLLDVCEGIAFVDCNVNGINDLCDVAAGVSADCNQDGIPDSCQYDSDPDCNQNGFLDSCDILQGFSEDCDGNLIPDDCELDPVTDSDSNGILDICEGLGFRRGDSNGDGSLDVSDAVNVLEVIFGSASSTCLDAADFNDDGDLNIADAVYGLATLFSGGATPPDPGPDSCGFDPTEDQLDCQSYSGC